MKIRVMAVEDSQFVHEEMKHMLEGTEIEISAFCRSGEEALVQYEKVRPDVVTMDIILPGMDGLDTTRRIIEKWPDARVLMVSSLAYDDTAQWSHELGARGVIYKPFTAEDLIHGIQDTAASVNA